MKTSIPFCLVSSFKMGNSIRRQEILVHFSRIITAIDTLQNKIKEQNAKLISIQEDIVDLQRSLARLDYMMSSVRYEMKGLSDQQDTLKEGFKRSMSDRYLCRPFKPPPMIDESGYVIAEK